jgi:hypothetical protein
MTRNKYIRQDIQNRFDNFYVGVVIGYHGYNFTDMFQLSRTIKVPIWDNINTLKDSLDAR